MANEDSVLLMDSVKFHFRGLIIFFFKDIMNASTFKGQS